MDLRDRSFDYQSDYDFSELGRAIFEWLGLPNVGGYSWSVGQLLENLRSWLVLRMFAENADNLDLRLFWAFADVVEGGWVKLEDVVHPLDDRHRFLIVTEGSSDASIIKKALELRRPKAADFQI